MNLAEEILRLKKEKNAVILAHNYQTPDIYDVADFIGDSLGLSVKARETDADIIIFCGVDFMAEAAKLLNPEKKVLHPEPGAKCPMAMTVDIDMLKDIKKQNPGAKVVCYINTSAETKAESDVVCTSMNAAAIVKGLEGNVIFIPDKHLGRWVEKQSGKKMILWQGCCHVHDNIKLSELERLRKEHPKAKVIAHPESPAEIVNAADHVTGTGGMITYAKESDAEEFIIATEEGMCKRLEREVPGKKFYPCAGVCPNMKKITLQKVYESLRDEKYEVTVPEELAKRARNALDMMLKKN